VGEILLGSHSFADSRFAAQLKLGLLPFPEDLSHLWPLVKSSAGTPANECSVPLLLSTFLVPFYESPRAKGLPPFAPIPLIFQSPGMTEPRVFSALMDFVHCFVRLAPSSIRDFLVDIVRQNCLLFLQIVEHLDFTLSAEPFAAYGQVLGPFLGQLVDPPIISGLANSVIICNSRLEGFPADDRLFRDLYSKLCPKSGKHGPQRLLLGDSFAIHIRKRLPKICQQFDTLWGGIVD
jgi:hypothetical protein